MWMKQYLGPSIGWIQVPASSSTFPITAAGTYSIDLSITYVTVNVAGSVTLILPSTLHPVAGATAVPGPFANSPIVIADLSGNAFIFPITIQPAAGDTIMGLASIQLNANFGAFTLVPNSGFRTWNSVSP